jgi:hypothetical protein
VEEERTRKRRQRGSAKNLVQINSRVGFGAKQVLEHAADVLGLSEASVLEAVLLALEHDADGVPKVLGSIPPTVDDARSFASPAEASPPRRGRGGRPSKGPRETFSLRVPIPLALRARSTAATLGLKMNDYLARLVAIDNDYPIGLLPAAERTSSTAAATGGATDIVERQRTTASSE